MITLLIIDPTGFKVPSIRAALDEIGIEYQVKQFTTVEQALATAEPESALCTDLLVINFRLPSMSASEGIQRLRTIKCLALKPAVVMVYSAWQTYQVPEAGGFLMVPITTCGVREMLDLIP